MTDEDSKRDGIWRHFWRTWRAMFTIQALGVIVGLCLVIPVLSIAATRAISESGSQRLSDLDLLHLVFDPEFPLVILAFVALWLLIHVFGFAAQLHAAHASVRGVKVSATDALMKTGASILPLSRLALQFLLQACLIILPFLLVLAGVFAIQFQDQSITRYLAERPPEFLFAVAFSIAILGTMIVVLAKTGTRLVHALPLLLFCREKPSSALRKSRKKSRPIRKRAFAMNLLWLTLTPTLAIVVNAAWVPLALWSAETLDHRLSLLALALSLILSAALLIAVWITFVSLSLFAIQHVRLFHQAGLDTDEAPANATTTAPWIRRLVLGGVITAGLVTIGLSYHSLSQLKVDDQVRIIADRGASADFPENTILAIDRALHQGSDGIAIDVRQSATGMPVVFRDPTFERIANLPLSVAEATGDDLATIDVGTWKDEDFHEQRVPTLSEIIESCPEDTELLLLIPELESDTLQQKLINSCVEQIDLAGMTHRTSFVFEDIGQITSFHQRHPSRSIGLRTEGAIDGPIDAPAGYLIVPATSVDHALISKLHRIDLEVLASGPADPSMMSAAISRGIDGLVLDEPGIGRKVLEERAILNPVERLMIEGVSRLRHMIEADKNRSPSSP